MGQGLRFRVFIHGVKDVNEFICPDFGFHSFDRYQKTQFLPMRGRPTCSSMCMNLSCA